MRVYGCHDSDEPLSLRFAGEDREQYKMKIERALLLVLAMLPTYPGRRFRLKCPIRASIAENGETDLIYVPANSTITVLDSLMDSNEPNREVRGQWMGKDVHMFAVDILKHAENCGTGRSPVVIPPQTDFEGRYY
jgi:hypothetical protein